jgi:hypothetical protein
MDLHTCRQTDGTVTFTDGETTMVSDVWLALGAMR